jgi:hypothetical protein
LRRQVDGSTNKEASNRNKACVEIAKRFDEWPSEEAWDIHEEKVQFDNCQRLAVTESKVFHCNAENAE